MHQLAACAHCLTHIFIPPYVCDHIVYMAVMVICTKEKTAYVSAKEWCSILKMKPIVEHWIISMRTVIMVNWQEMFNLQFFFKLVPSITCTVSMETGFASPLSCHSQRWNSIPQDRCLTGSTDLLTQTIHEPSNLGYQQSDELCQSELWILPVQ